MSWVSFDLEAVPCNSVVGLRRDHLTVVVLHPTFVRLSNAILLRTVNLVHIVHHSCLEARGSRSP